MNKKSLRITLGLLMCLITIVITVLPVYAAAYKSYTYSIDGTQLDSPNAYEPDKLYNSEDMKIFQNTGFMLTEPQDLVVDVDGNIYIVDVATREIEEGGSTKTEKLHRIICLDPYFQFRYQLTSFENEMKQKVKRKLLTKMH